MAEGVIPKERGQIHLKEGLEFALTVAKQITPLKIALRKLVILLDTRPTSPRIHHHHLRSTISQMLLLWNQLNRVHLHSPLFNLHKRCIKAFLKLFSSQNLVLSQRPTQ
jgi:hypothetical protein